MVAAYVQAVTPGTSGSSNPVTGAFPGSTVTGNLIVAVSSNDSGVTNYVTGVTDSKGNTYQRAFSAVETNVGTDLEIWYAMNIAGGASHTLTWGWSAAAASNISWNVQEFSGLALSAALDQVSTAIGQGTGTTATAGATPATTQAGELVVVAGYHNGATTTATAGAGYSNLGKGGVSPVWSVMESKVVAATGVQTGTFTLGASRSWAGAIATFKEPGAGGGAVARTGMLAYA